MARRRLAGAAGTLALLVGLAAGTVAAADRDVAISDFTFTPRTVTVNVGDTVTWTNEDAQTHTATSGNAWDSGDIDNGRSKSITFRTSGRYDYICIFHPQMRGTVVVRAGSAPLTDTATGAARGELPRSGGPGAGTIGLLAIVIVIATALARRRFAERAGPPPG